MGTPVPSSNDLVNIWVPAVSRFSDLAWTVYKDFAAVGRSHALQYICHEQVSDLVTAETMKYIIRRHRAPNATGIPFPGLEFDMQTAEGQAMLGTLNGLGTIWLLADRAWLLGRRNLKVNLWTEGQTLLLAWNMEPVR